MLTARSRQNDFTYNRENYSEVQIDSWMLFKCVYLRSLVRVEKFELLSSKFSGPCVLVKIADQLVV